MISPRSVLAGLGHSVPPRIMTNLDLEKMVETSDEWIRTRTGIRERRIAEPGTGTSKLAAEAALAALKDAKLDPKEVELIITATTTPDMPLPSTSCLVQHKIGAVKAAAFDLAAACSGFVYALATADSFIRSGVHKNILVIGADVISPYIDWTDRSTCVLFGDGAGAAVLRAGDKGGILSHSIGSDGQYADLLKIECGGSRQPATHKSVESRGHYLKMSGAEVFKLAVRGMSDSVLDSLSKAHVKKEDIAWFIPHQANQRIIDAVGERLELPKEKIFLNLDRYGNTSAASCAIALSEAVQSGKVKRGDKLVLATFGSGLVWGAMVLEW